MKKHTLIKYKIFPLNQKSFNNTLILNNILLKDKNEAIEYLEFGNAGNYVIQKHVDESIYGILKDWEVLTIKILTDNQLEKYNTKTYLKSRLKEIKKENEIAIPKAITMMNEVDSRKIINNITKLKNDLTYCSFWMDLNGVIHEVYGVAQHNNWAFEYLESIYGNDFFKIDNTKYPYEILLDLGWIKYTGWSTRGFSKSYDTILTPAQIKTIKDFCLFNNIDYPDYINEIYTRN